MEIEYSGVDESLIKWRYNTEPWHIAYITDLIAKWESDKAKENTFVKHISTVAVRPVANGHWIQDRLCSTSGGTYGVRRCSVCEHYYQEVGYGWNYCPNCGAKMDERREDDTQN